MRRYIAFLRAVNVGGRTVKMDRLRELFAEFGFHGSETFLASGNVLFSTVPSKTIDLEMRIANGLQKALGYEVCTFVRTEEEVTAIAGFAPFPQTEIENAAAFNVALVSRELDPGQTQILIQHRNEFDDFRIHGREIYSCA